MFYTTVKGIVVFAKTQLELAAKVQRLLED